MRARTTREARERMTTAVREWFAAGGRGDGFLAFRADGTGGAWYSDDVYGLGPDIIRVPLEPSDPEDAECLVDRALARYEEVVGPDTD